MSMIESKNECEHLCGILQIDNRNILIRSGDIQPLRESRLRCPVAFCREQNKAEDRLHWRLPRSQEIIIADYHLDALKWPFAGLPLFPLALRPLLLGLSMVWSCRRQLTTDEWTYLETFLK